MLYSIHIFILCLVLVQRSIVYLKCAHPSLESRVMIVIYGPAVRCCSMSPQSPPCVVCCGPDREGVALSCRCAPSWEMMGLAEWRQQGRGHFIQVANSRPYDTYNDITYWQCNFVIASLVLIFNSFLSNQNITPNLSC